MRISFRQILLFGLRALLAKKLSVCPKVQLVVVAGLSSTNTTKLMVYQIFLPLAILKCKPTMFYNQTDIHRWRKLPFNKVRIWQKIFLKLLKIKNLNLFYTKTVVVYQLNRNTKQLPIYQNFRSKVFLRG